MKEFLDTQLNLMELLHHEEDAEVSGQKCQVAEGNQQYKGSHCTDNNCQLHNFILKGQQGS